MQIICVCVWVQHPYFCEMLAERFLRVHSPHHPLLNLTNKNCINFRATQREHVVRHMITVHKVQPERSAKARKKKRQEISTDTDTEDVSKSNVDDDSKTDVSKEQTTPSEQEQGEENKVPTIPRFSTMTFSSCQ